MHRFRTALIFAPMTYDAVRARKHAMLQAARAAGLDAIYVEPPNSRSAFAGNGRRPLLNRPGQLVATSDGARVLATPKKWGAGSLRFALPRRRMERFQASWLRRALERERLCAPTLAIVTSARWTRILRGVEFDALVYDRNDEPDVLRGWLSREEYAAREAELLDRTQLLVSPSRALLERGREGRSGLAARLIPNGVDTEAFLKRRSLPVPELDGERRPIAGFIGTLAWFTDVELLVEAAVANPDVYFPIVGPVQGGVDVSLLEARENISLWGEVPHERVPSIVGRFDVCLVPFRAGPVSDSLCPVKFFEYLCLGKPIVSTPMPELAALADLYYAGRESFAANVARAVAEDDPTLAERRRLVAREHGWDRLFEQLLEAVPIPSKH
jgi:glycosyltransferase involved in cell wall biosynthesis